MFVLQLQADDLHTALGRLLDQARVAGLRLAAVQAGEEISGGFEIRASFDEPDREAIEKLGRRIAKVFGVAEVEVRHDPQLRLVERRLAAAC